MKFKTRLILFFLLLFTQKTLLLSTIRVVCTTALTKNHFDFRKQQYCQAFEMLRTLGCDNPYIIEACKNNAPSFLDLYSQYVFYATVNDPTLRNNGINEAKTLLEGCAYFNFYSEDMIIKLTGRHRVTSDYLLKIVKENPEIDAFVKINSDGNVYTIGFAMRYKYLREMLENIDYAELERGMIPIEYRVGDFIKRKKKDPNFKVLYLEKLDIQADPYGSSTAPGVAHDIVIF